MLAGCWARLWDRPGRRRDSRSASIEAPAGLDAVLELEGNHAAGLRHLPLRQCILREARQAGVMHHRDLGVTGENFATPCALAQWRSMRKLSVFRPRSTRKASCAAQHRAGHILDAVEAYLVECFLRADDGAGQQVAMAAEILGGRMQHEIGAEFKRALQVGRAVGVIDNRSRAMAARNRSNRPRCRSAACWDWRATRRTRRASPD